MKDTLFGKTALLGMVVLVGCAEPTLEGVDELEVVAHCTYVNPFSELEECREYLGDGWTLESAEENCSAQDDSSFAAGACGYESTLGACVVNGGQSDVYRLQFPGDDKEQCSSLEVGCEVFGGGIFVPAEPCGGLPNLEVEPGLVYINAEERCVEPVDGIPGQEADGKVCTWNAIGGCTEEGRDFSDYGSCSDVRSQRGYYPVPESDFETPADDPILQDPAFRMELDWVKEQVASCGCVCCHDSQKTPQGGSNWIIDSDKEVWTDGFFPSGLAVAAGWIDSSLLGAYAPHENNGFGRDEAGIPSTDQARMVNFFEGELARRGFVREDFADATPIPSVFYQQAIYEPDRCDDGVGIDRDGKVHWKGGEARYVYLLEPGSDNPGVPPNLDLPEGTRWLLEVYWDEDPMASGLSYPEGPARASQRVAGQTLIPGMDYTLIVLADVGLPITRCIFTY
jgi:hypothetical protein